MTREELQRIRDTDEAAGADLQGCPLAWQQRRELLAHVKELEDQLTTLSTPNSWQGPDGSLSLERDIFHSQPLHMRAL